MFGCGGAAEGLTLFRKKRGLNSEMPTLGAV